MKNVISLVSSKPADLEFEVGIEGLTPDKVIVRLCMETKEHSLSFNCKKKKQNKWECHIPPLHFLEKGTYPYYIEVIADGYYFKATDGIANVSGSFDVYAKKPEKVTSPDIKKKETKTSEKNKTPTSSKTKPTKETVEPEKVVRKFQDLDSLIDQLLNKEKTIDRKETIVEKKDKIVSKGKVVEKKEEKPKPIKEKKETPAPITKISEKKSSVKDDAIHNILESLRKQKEEKKVTTTQKTNENKQTVIEKKPVVEKKEKDIEKAKTTKTGKGDDAVKKIIKNLSKVTESKDQEKTMPVVHFKKGKRVVN